jgi:hypothetical protein
VGSRYVAFGRISGVDTVVRRILIARSGAREYAGRIFT